MIPVLIYIKKVCMGCIVLCSVVLCCAVFGCVVWALHTAPAVVVEDEERAHDVDEAGQQQAAHELHAARAHQP